MRAYFVVLSTALMLAGCKSPQSASGTAEANGATAPSAAAPASAPQESWRTLLDVRPSGWANKAGASEPAHESMTATAPSGRCTLAVDLWAGLPPSPGGPMMAQSKRSVVVDGRKVDVVKTSQFQGRAQVVDAVFVNDGTSYARAVFRECTDAEVDFALGSAKLAKAVRGAP
jgi:hypothetical protein